MGKLQEFYDLVFKKVLHKDVRENVTDDTVNDFFNDFLSATVTDPDPEPVGDPVEIPAGQFYFVENKDGGTLYIGNSDGVTTRLFSLDEINQTSEMEVITTPNTFTGETFHNKYFDFTENVADLNFTSCTFTGVCYIKNTSGAVNYTTCKGGIVISNRPIPDTVRGYGDVTHTEF